MTTVLAASAGNVLVWIVWVVAAFAALGSGVAVVSFSNPFYSALALIGNLGSLAVMYLLVSAEFVAAAQVLVYAGAVMVMFLFVIAYVGPDREPAARTRPRIQTVGAVAAAGALLVEIVVAIGLKAGGRLSHTDHVGNVFGSPGIIGSILDANGNASLATTVPLNFIAAAALNDLITALQQPGA